MTLALEGANALISEFGEDVVITEIDLESAEDPNDPIYIDSSGSEGQSSTHRVRLYTTPSKEMLEDYGLEETADSMMYATEDIASQGDKVEYDPMDYEWVVGEIATSQIGEGPYLFVYELIKQ